MKLPFFIVVEKWHLFLIKIDPKMAGDGEPEMFETTNGFSDGSVSSKWWHWMIHDYTLNICEFFQCQDPPEPAITSIHLDRNRSLSRLISIIYRALI